MDVAPPAMQLSYDQETIEAGLIDNSNLQPLVLPLDTSMKYALVRGGRSGAPEGCVLLTVNDPKVSSCHLLLEFVWSGSATGCWMLTDGNGTKRSTNGVLVDQQRVPAEPVALRPGSRISVKSSKVTLHLELTPEAQAKADSAAAAAAKAKAAEAGAAAETVAEAEAAAEPVAASSEVAAESKVKAQVKAEAEAEAEAEEPRAAGGPAARQLLVYSARPSGETGLVTQPLGFVKISFGDKLPALHRKIVKEGLGAHFAQAGFQFLMPMGAAQVPLWEPQYKEHRVRDILHAPRENAGGISDCVTVRAIPPRAGAGPGEEPGDVTAAPAQQGAPSGGPAGGADGGAAAGGAAAAAGGAAAAAVGGAPSRKPRAVYAHDPADPKPRTAYAIFTEERTRELLQEREQGEQPPLSRKDMQQQVCAEWKDPGFRQERKRELDEQQKRLKSDWTKRRKRAAPSPVPVGYTTPVCNAAEADQGDDQGDEVEPGSVAAEVLLSPGEVPKYSNVAELHTGGFHVEEMD